MAIERTLSIVKPDAFEKNVLGKILAIYQEGGLKIVAGRVTTFTKEQAESFYAVHNDKPFFGELVEFMTRGPIFVSILEGENAVAHHRSLMGATNPADAAEGTVRAHFGASISENAVHGSDSVENAEKEIALVFPEHAS